MNGFSRLLERMHGGEPLDDVIRRVSHAKYLDPEDFGSHFICGDEDGTDWETASPARRLRLDFRRIQDTIVPVYFIDGRTYVSHEST